VHRLFVAIQPPRKARAQLLAMMGGVSGARWQDEDQLHLTLRFIGEIGPHAADDVHAALGAIHHPAFEIALGGIGTFDRKGGLTTLWAGVTPHEPLKALHNKIDLACIRAGLEPERRAFLPHITLARLGRGAVPIHTLGSASTVFGPTFAVEDFCLYESRLTAEKAVYSIVERYRLDPFPLTSRRQSHQE
jgi:2'-5' RNA ligase